MILAELHGYKRYLDKDFFELMYGIEKMTNGGATINDHGEFSVVVIPKSGDKVYKVWTNDDGYESYYHVCQRLQGNPFVPKVSRIHKLPIFFKQPESVDGFLKIVKIERLTYKGDDQLAHSGLTLFLKTLITKSGLTGYTAGHIEKDIELFLKLHQEYDILKGQGKDLYDVLVAIRQILVNNEDDIQLDMHEGNVMFRGNQPVIIDPTCVTDEMEEYQKKKGVLFLKHLTTDIESIDRQVSSGELKSSSIKSGSRPKIRS